MNVRTLANTLSSLTSVAGSDGRMRADQVSDAKVLMQLTVEEWDCREAEKKSVLEQMENDNSTALMIVPNEEHESTSSDRQTQCQKTAQCWNCGKRGHRCDTCASPRPGSEDDDFHEMVKW